MRWKFSHLKNTCAPARSSTVREVITGVRLAWPASRSRRRLRPRTRRGAAAKGRSCPDLTPEAEPRGNPAPLRGPAVPTRRRARLRPEVAGVGPGLDRPAPPAVDPHAVHRRVRHAERARHLERDVHRVTVDDAEHAAVGDHRDGRTGVASARGARAPRRPGRGTARRSRRRGRRTRDRAPRGADSRAAAPARSRPRSYLSTRRSSARGGRRRAAARARAWRRSAPRCPGYGRDRSRRSRPRAPPRDAPPARRPVRGLPRTAGCPASPGDGRRGSTPSRHGEGAKRWSKSVVIPLIKVTRNQREKYLAAHCGGQQASPDPVV